jgi:enoyl-CoA hydratase
MNTTTTEKTITMTNITSSIENKILFITINRPDKLNALTTQTIAEIHEVLHTNSNNSQVQVVIITGQGQKAFVAGADISEFASFNEEQGKKLSQDGHTKLFNFIENYTKPVIAAVNGFALGGGLELALACHIRVASENAKMGFPELNLGVIPGYGGTQRLAQIVGKGKAFELILTADMVDANEAYRLNLVNHVSTLENLMTKCIEIANKIISKSPLAAQKAILTINANYEYNVDGYETEVNQFGACFSSSDFKEGVAAFLEKRKPVFTGN